MKYVKGFLKSNRVLPHGSCLSRREFGGLLAGGFLAVSQQLSAMPPASASLPSVLRPALCAYSFRRELAAGKLHYSDLIEMAAKTGLDGLDFTVYWFPNRTAGYLAALRHQAYRLGLQIYSISIRTDFCQPSSAARQKEVERVRQWVDVAQLLGASHIRVFGGEVPEGSTERQAISWVAEALKEASDYSSQKGVILGLENHGGITSRAETVLEIVEKASSPWVGINLDTGNFLEQPYEQVELCAPYAVNVQVKRYIRGPNNQREAADWPRLIEILRRNRYRGYVALEYEGGQALEQVPELLKELKQLCRQVS